MMRHTLALLLLVAGITCSHASDIDLSTSKGTDQAVIVQLTPSPAQIDVWNNAKIEVTFNAPIDASSVQKNNIKLVHLSSKNNDHIDGAISYDKYDNKVVFVPSDLLPVGAYEVEIKSLKPSKDYKSEQIKEIKYRFYIPEVIHGHQLPPEPDPVVNNSTLLGIDVNNNDVRDDVEIWILNTYKDKHPIYIDIAMQAARGYKKALQTPQAAREIYREVNSALYCEFYYKDYAENFNDPMLIDQYDYLVGYDLREEIYLNTPQRLKVYEQYNKVLSGGTYPLPKIGEYKDFCDFNTSKYGE